MAKKMRVTYHNGRANKQGVYSAKHNDRHFDTEKAEHIEKEKANQNVYWQYYQDIEPNLSFEECEMKYYNEHFTNYLELRNEKSIRQGHRERVQTIKDYHNSHKSCPEETIFQVGNVNNNLVSKDELEFIFKQYLQWQRENYPQIVTLNWAYHADEQGAGHIHARQVWLAHDDTGEMVNQGKSLKEMGIERPETDKKEGRYNNAKMTYTKVSREKFAEICRANGIEIEEKPLEASKTGKDLIEWQTEQDKRKAEEANAELQKANAEHKEIIAEITRMETYLAEISEMADVAEVKIAGLKLLDEERKRHFVNEESVRTQRLKSLKAEANAERERAEAEKKRAEENKALADAENIRLENLRVTDAERQQKFIADENTRQQHLKDLENKEQEVKKSIENLEKEFENKKKDQKIVIDALETCIKNKRDEIDAIYKEIIAVKEQREAKNKELREIKADLNEVVAIVEDYKNKWRDARQNKNYNKELQIVKNFFSWYNPDGRKELEYFFDELPKTAKKIKNKIKSTTKSNNNSRGWGR